jgi:hypothetical protein
MDVVRATQEFEKWLSGRLSMLRTEIVPSQLTAKHAAMAEHPVPFLRGSFYRWTQVFPEVCPDLQKAPAVLAVGDLHIASFGTWRDVFGRLIWGVDDFDDAYPLPYTNDLVRLGVSAVLDAAEGEIGVGLRNVCEVILDGYRAGLAAGGKAFVLEEQHKWLRKIALDRLDPPPGFWKKMDALPVVQNSAPPEARKAFAKLLPAARLEYRVVRRIAGIGSLGRPRYVAIVNWCGGRIALEAKAATPSACAWAKPVANPRIHYQEVLDRAARCPDPFVRLCGTWLIRQLAPDSSPIDIETMQGQNNQDRLLHAMAWEAANIHLGTKSVAKRILADLARRPGKWLRSAVKEMAKGTINDWRAWKKAHSK